MATQAVGRKSPSIRKSPDSPTTLLTIPATGDRLGCSPMHVYRLISSGELRAVDVSQPGSRKPKTRVRSDDIDAYIEARTRRAGSPANPQPA
jgi:excisionase family DNA binding protein